MMKVLLVSPTVDTCYERVASIGLMNLYLIAKGVGCEVEYLDLTETSYSEGLKYIISKRYDVIGISCNFTNAAPYCIQYSKDIKERYPDTLVISGGNHATLVPEDLLLNGYDYIIYGEGEGAFKDFLKRVLSRKSLEDLKGIYYLKDGNIIKNLPFEQIEDLDTLPLNDYSNFDLEPYFKKSGLRYISLETSRGCIHNCSFCSTVRMWGHNYRQKSPQRVLKEFKIAQDLNLDFVFIEDDDVAINEKCFRDFCQLLIDEEISVSWGCTIGSKSIKDFSTFDIMSKSGCIKVNICVESANPRLLKEYRKPYNASDNRRVFLELRRRGIIVHNHGIIGFPDETLKESLNTYFHLINNSSIWHVSILEPRPGSDYWNDWTGSGNVSQYRLFGKANVILSRNKIWVYFIYRFFALFYFCNIIRLYKSMFHKNKAVRYSYRIQYWVAYKTIKQNILSFIGF